MENKQRLQKTIKEQQKQIKQLEDIASRLEIKVEANEIIVKNIMNELREIRQISNRTFWLVLFTFCFVIILLGSK